MMIPTCMESGQNGWINGITMKTAEVTSKAVSSYFNPVNPEDRDGDGRDYDDPDVLGYGCPDLDTLGETIYTNIMLDRWWDYNPTNDPAKDVPWQLCRSSQLGRSTLRRRRCTWIPMIGTVMENTVRMTRSPSRITFNYYPPYYNPNYPTIDTYPSISPLSTCTGCGLRMASNKFKTMGPARGCLGGRFTL